MKTAFAFLPLLVLSSAALIAQNPVPTRVKTEIDGPATGVPDPVDLALGLVAARVPGPALTFRGGIGGNGALLAFGLKPAEILLPYNALLQVDPLVIVAGSFDEAGELTVPVDVADTSFIGIKLYAQGLHFALIGPTKPVVYFQMTPRFAVEYFEGNEQPPLAYEGPPLTATLLAKRDHDMPMTYEVLTKVAVPSGGYELNLVSVDNNGATVIYLSLVKPNPDEIVTDPPETKQVFVDLGVEAREKIEVYVEVRIRGVPGLPVYKLAAMMLRDF